MDTHLWISTDIMDIVTHQMAKTVWHEQAAESDFHHFVNRAMDQTYFDQLLQLNAVSKKMHIHPRYTLHNKRSLTTKITTTIGLKQEPGFSAFWTATEAFKTASYMLFWSFVNFPFTGYEQVMSLA